MFKNDDIGCQRQNPIKKIIAQISEYINNKAANKMTTSLYYDRAQVVHDMRNYGYKTVGEYARANTNIFKILFSKNY